MARDGRWCSIAPARDIDTISGIIGGTTPFVRGVLWTDGTQVGYLPAPGSDPAPMREAISSATGTPDEVFDQLAADHADTISEGDVDIWNARTNTPIARP